MTREKLLHNIHDMALHIMSSYKSNEKFNISLTSADIINVLNGVYQAIEDNNYPADIDALNYKSVLNAIKVGIKGKSN